MLPITYGWCSHASYIDAGEAIAQDVDQGNMSSVVEKINVTFFQGGAFAPKSFSDLASIKMPAHPSYITHEADGRVRVEITKQTSASAVLGYVEAIPVIGSVLAIINAIGHLFYMLSSYQALKRAVVELKATERNDYNMGRGACAHYTHKVFDAAVDYTIHRNYLTGSLLSIVPFAKPIVRLAQGALYRPPVQQPA